MARPVEILERRPHRRGAPDREQAPLHVILRCFGTAIGANTAMLLGREGRRNPVLLAAWGLAARRSTVPWVSGSFLGGAMKAHGTRLEPAAGTPGNGAGTWSAVATPILGPEGSLGALYAGFEPPSGLRPAELRWIAESHAALAALCMNGGGDVAATLRSAGIDPLTGCLTYERILEMVRAEIERSKRGDHALACCFLDIDGFMRVNEDHGNLEGNRVLATAGDALRSAARPYDGVGRFGGDEFVVVLPETTAAGARGTIERMRLGVTAAVQGKVGVSVEVSAGIAEWQSEDSAVNLLDASDHALQRAKAAGGARIAGEISPAGRVDGMLERARAVARRQQGAGHGLTEWAGG